MAALNRKPQLPVKGSMTLSDGTAIDLVAVPVRSVMNLSKNKTLSEEDRGIHAIAMKLRVNGMEIRPDDLYDCFNDDELKQIVSFVSSIEGDEETKKND